MLRKFLLINFFFLSAVVFFTMTAYAQDYSPVRVFGPIPNADDNRLYQIQVGSFRVASNAARAHEMLRGASLVPVYETYGDFTRVLVGGIRAAQVPSYIERLRSAGFSDILIKLDRSGVSAPIISEARSPFSVAPISALPVSAAALPSAALSEIANRTVRIGETRSLADLVEGRRVESWTSSTPQAVTVDADGIVTGLGLGNAYIKINDTEYISVAVAPREDFFVVPESMAALLPPESASGESSTSNLTEYRTEPTFRLAYRFNNKGEHRGASGMNGGIDILGRGANYEWLWTTFAQGGWFYDLNGVKREMIDGFQRGANGVELTVYPEFVYDRGVPYLQLRHILANTGSRPVTGQRFGASADVMIHANDHASLVHTPYGAYMTDSEYKPSLELMFICESGDGIDPVDTLWLGAWNNGAHLDYIYTDRRRDVYYEDSAIAFSYQNIDLAPGEIREFIVRFTLARIGG